MDASPGFGPNWVGGSNECGGGARWPFTSGRFVRKRRAHVLFRSRCVPRAWRRSEAPLKVR
eukprot:2946977-Pyramimonas_sp.AAC.1